MSGWIAMNRSEEADLLQEGHPAAFLLLCQIGRRARWRREPCAITGLGYGQAMIGDWKRAGLQSEKSYRHAMGVLSRAGIVAFKGANKGTVATLLDTRIFRIEAEAKGDQTGEPMGVPRGTLRGERTGEPGATKKKERRKEDSNPPLPPKGDGDSDLFEIEPLPKDNGRVLPDGWKKIPKPDRKTQRVLRNNKLMERIGSWFNRKPSNLWTLEEGIKLSQIKPASDDIETLEAWYLAPDVGDLDIRRRDLVTLLNNWTSDLDRARIWRAENP